ncbi:hypothetical protein HMPREF1092_00901 [Clostridium thermobutyricum]|uniref:Uncharacterized protein n=1 Tax=Clostridium thermobutyricum TaxID=29372 RepID=N9Y1H4_9CLOT|nr:hypothetical protein [Clostridium thermobutyricum]ENZ01667.1 hypothetical protein HMPREF1092_00901 [Clostridium thermobutyricum]
MEMERFEIERFNIGDKVSNINNCKVGIIVRIYKNGSIAVLEKVAPTVISTHDSNKTLSLVEKNSVPIYDETL